MMKFDEREIRAAMDRRLSALEASEDRRRAICLRIGEEGPVVKRKLTVSAALALALIMTLTGVALAAGIANLFEYFGKEDERLAMVADRAVLETQKPESVETETLGRTVGTIHNAYYDGQTLLVGYSIANGSRVELYTPTQEQLSSAKMERIEYEPAVETGAERRVLAEFRAAKKRGEPCGLAMYLVYPADHSYGNGVDLEAWSERKSDLSDGTQYMLREYITPLPEEVQDQDEVTIKMAMREQATYLWFDGEATWFFHGEPREAGEMTAVVHRTESEILHFAGTGEYNGAEVQATAQVSAVRGELTLTGDGVFTATADRWYDFRLYDERGVEYRMDSMAVNDPGNVEASFYGMGTLPEKLSLVICVESEGDMKSQPVAEPIELALSE